MPNKDKISLCLLSSSDPPCCRKASGGYHRYLFDSLEHMLLRCGLELIE